MGTQSKIEQTSSVTKTMTEIARILMQAQEDLSEFDISKWFHEYEGPPEGAQLILSQDLAKYYIRSRDDSDPLYPALASVLRLYAKSSVPWGPVVRRLIRSGANVHARVRRNLSYLDQSEYLCPLDEYGTSLDELFIYTTDPFEGQVAANGWLQILTSEGLNVLTYLEEESTLHKGPMQLTHPSYRTMGYENERKLIFDWGPRPTVSWDWRISPSSSASLVREEFRLMATNPPPDGLLIKRSWKEAWLVRYPVWSEWHQCYGGKRKLLKRANERAAERLRRKAGKMARVDRYEGLPKVPGAWPM